MRSPAISVSHELHLLLGALDAVLLLSRQIAEHHFVGKEGERAARAVAASLVVVRERLRLLDRVLRDVVDARALIAPENRATRDEGSEDERDVQLPSWGTKRARRELERQERAEQTQRKQKKLKSVG